MLKQQRDLEHNEKIVYCAKLSLWPYFFNILLGILLIPVLIGIYILLKIIIEYVSVSYVITDKRFLASSGFLSTRIEEINHNRAFGLVIEQSFLGRLLGYGSITLRSPLGHEGDFVGMLISDPIKFADIYRQRTQQRRPRINKKQNP